MERSTPISRPQINRHGRFPHRADHINQSGQLSAIRSWHPRPCCAPTLFLYINHNYGQINILAGHFLRTTGSQIGFFAPFFRRLFSTTILLLCATFRRATGSGYIRHYFYLLCSFFHLILFRLTNFVDVLTAETEIVPSAHYVRKKIFGCFLRLFKLRFPKCFLCRTVEKPWNLNILQKKFKKIIWSIINVTIWKASDWFNNESKIQKKSNFHVKNLIKNIKHFKKPWFKL